MNKDLVTGIVSAAAVVVCGIGWLLLPSLQDSSRTIERDVSVQLERARRLLHKYEVCLAHETLLTDQLIDQGIEPDADEVSDTLADEYERAHGTMWNAYQPVDWSGGDARPARASYGNLAGQIRNGISAQSRSSKDNENLLDEALAAVREALSITHGGESSHAHAEANRLKGVILYHKGMAERVRAHLHRRTGEGHRRQLVALTIAATESVAAKSLVADSNVDGEIDRLEAQVTEIDVRITEDQEALAAMDERIAERENRLGVAESRRSEADEAKQRLRAAGIDFSDPNGAENFRTRLEDLDQTYRKADREAKSLLYGCYPNAQIDASHDYLAGQYLEDGSTTDLTIRRGLVHDRVDRAVLAARIELLQHGAEDVRSEIARLRERKSAFQEAETDAAERIEQSTTQASDVYTELNRIDAEAFTMEDRALELFEQSVRACEQAARSTGEREREAGERTRELPPDASARSAFAARADDRWMAGHIAAQVADARLAKAWVYYERFHTYTENARVLATVADGLGLDEEDTQTEQEKAQQAHDLGVDEITQAMKTLEQAHRDSGKHWTLTAQAAGTTYLLALFGHEDYVADAIETYREAVKGRENDETAATFVARLNQLEQR